MRNLLTVGLLIVTLIVGILLVQNMRSGNTTDGGTKKIESLKRAEEASDKAEDAARKRVRDIEALDDK